MENYQIFKFISRKLKNYYSSSYQRRKLDSFTEIYQFNDFLVNINSNFFIEKKYSNRKRSEFVSVVNELDVKLNAIRFLDIGPGYGDSLDVCHENEASCIEFVENDPFYFTYNRLKKYTNGFQIDHLFWLNKLYPMKYDLIWIKGSIIADHFICNDILGIKIHFLSHWLTQIERLASEKCKIVLCPYWLHNQNKREIENIYNNQFSKTLLSKGYVILSNIKDHNNDLFYPITYLKDMSLTSYKR
jgi:hypothetical protein